MVKRSDYLSVNKALTLLVWHWASCLAYLVLGPHLESTKNKAIVNTEIPGRRLSMLTGLSEQKLTAIRMLLLLLTHRKVQLRRRLSWKARCKPVSRRPTLWSQYCMKYIRSQRERSGKWVLAEGLEIGDRELWLMGPQFCLARWERQISDLLYNSVSILNPTKCIKWVIKLCYKKIISVFVLR